MLHFRISGLWNDEMMREFEGAIESAVEKLGAAGSSFKVLADLTDYPPQFQVIAARHQVIMGKLRDSGMRCAATIVSGQMTKIQVARLAPSETHHFATSESAARRWLDSV